MKSRYKESNINIGKNLKRLRQNAQMSQKEVAGLLNVNSSNVSNWESGYALPPADKFVDLCAIYGVKDVKKEFDSSRVWTVEEVPLLPGEIIMIKRIRELDDDHYLLFCNMLDCLIDAQEWEKLQEENKKKREEEETE